MSSQNDRPRRPISAYMIYLDSAIEKPRRPMSAYMIWLNSTREKLRAEYPNLKVTELAKKGGEIWSSIDKTEWEEKAAKSTEQYLKELKIYNEKKRSSNHDAVTDGSEDDGTDEEYMPTPQKRPLNSSRKGHTYEPETVDIQIKTETQTINESVISNSRGLNTNTLDEEYLPTPQKRPLNSSRKGHTYEPETVDIQIKTEPQTINESVISNSRGLKTNTLDEEYLPTPQKRPLNSSRKGHTYEPETVDIQIKTEPQTINESVISNSRGLKTNTLDEEYLPTPQKRPLNSSRKGHTYEPETVDIQIKTEPQTINESVISNSRGLKTNTLDEEYLPTPQKRPLNSSRKGHTYEPETVDIQIKTEPQTINESVISNSRGLKTNTLDEEYLPTPQKRPLNSSRKGHTYEPETVDIQIKTETQTINESVISNSRGLNTNRLDEEYLPNPQKRPLNSSRKGHTYEPETVDIQIKTEPQTINESVISNSRGLNTNTLDEEYLPTPQKRPLNSSRKGHTYEPETVDIQIKTEPQTINESVISNSRGLNTNTLDEEYLPTPQKRPLNSSRKGHTYEPETVDIQIKTEPQTINESVISNSRGLNSNTLDVVSKIIDKNKHNVTNSGEPESSMTVTSNATQSVSMENKEEAADYHFGRMLHYLMELPDGKEKVMKYVNILNAICKEN